METFNNTIHFLLLQLYPNLSEYDGWFQISQQNYSVKVEFNAIRFRLSPSFSKEIIQLKDTVIRCPEMKAEFTYNYDDDIGQIINFQSDVITQLGHETSESTMVLRANYLCNCVLFLANYFNRAYTRSQLNTI